MVRSKEISEKKKQKKNMNIIKKKYISIKELLCLRNYYQDKTILFFSSVYYKKHYKKNLKKYINVKQQKVSECLTHKFVRDGKI